MVLLCPQYKFPKFLNSKFNISSQVVLRTPIYFSVQI